MIKSMTGYGRGELCTESCKASIELKSVNHRYREIVLRLPRSLHILEGSIRQAVQEKIARGRVEVYLNVELSGEGRNVLKVDRDLAAAYLRAAKELQKGLQLAGEVTSAELLHLPGVFTLEEREEDARQWWPVLEGALAQALAALLEMRAREGRQLAEDISKRVERIKALIEEIRERSPQVVEEYRRRLGQRVRELLDPGIPVDPARLEAEVVLYAERSSITEEIVRLHSHLQQFADCLAGEGPVGRKLDFLLQEMNREVNTIASKSSDLAINRAVVDVKSELEKIREQVQNIE